MLGTAGKRGVGESLHEKDSMGWGGCCCVREVGVGFVRDHELLQDDVEWERTYLFPKVLEKNGTTLRNAGDTKLSGAVDTKGWHPEGPGQAGGVGP